MHTVNDDFVERVRSAFNPYTTRSGTENLGPWLYSLIRSCRFTTVVEFGGGFTTPFIARALADNAADFDKDRRVLGLWVEQEAEFLKETLRELDAGGRIRQERFEEFLARLDGTTSREAVSPAPNPFFFLRAYRPHVYTWEPASPTGEYVAALESLIEELGLASYVTIRAGAAMNGYLGELPPSLLPLDMVWSDWGHKLAFFEETYEHLRPDGGILALHSPAVYPEEIREIKKRLAGEVSRGECELFTLLEPHKLSQNGCLLIRKCRKELDTRARDPRAGIEALLALRDAAAA